MEFARKVATIEGTVIGSSEKTVSNHLDCIVGKVQRSLLKWNHKCMMDVAYFASGSTLEMMSG